MDQRYTDRKARDVIGSDIIVKSSKRPAVRLMNDMA